MRDEIGARLIDDEKDIFARHRGLCPLRELFDEGLFQAGEAIHKIP
jgi:hypothetical protein